jgi:hypothetical protein
LDWRKLLNKELHNLYSSSDIIKIIKLRRMGWVRNVVYMGKERCACRISVGKPEGRRQLRRYT